MTSKHFLEALSKTVREQRKRLGVSQVELAELAGCGRGFVIQLEQGKQTLRLDTLLSVLNVLGLELSLSPRRPMPEKN
jgi:y4mF family transcriptional regulator